ncbi:translesion error-prone DNA polymerase V autoproteolytic subunit [Sansalvadorimonas verongulae]|uniref:translesion error-prone DNA polymerase V autoproteolytic subunit n=1 Tax=Sansalvadorimonas verongulae TaxID=2172824 RepID=UPI0012BCA1A8|nr:translesion error-prone DNA polymerase V autoproteolytic subunit [Sansalvadorimonas verongulae]MTI12511.1 translesion error-prone DNA polymerase V autoproteolytic subunit [Sansalvadorimonas verongulae]
MAQQLYPFYEAPAACGFPSPAADYMEQRLSLDDLLVEHPAATFFARAQGASMEGVGIFDGDILIVDRSLTPSTGDVVMCLLDGELCIKTLKKTSHATELHSANAAYTPIILSDGQTLDVWGVVVHVIHSLR